MAPWTFNVKVLYDTQFLFRTLVFAIGEDKNLKLLTRGPTPRHPRLIYEKALYNLIDLSASSASSGSYSGLNPYTGSYHLSTVMSYGYPIGAPIFHPSTGTSSSTSSGASPGQDSIEDYPEIGGRACWNPDIEAHCIGMVGPTRANSQKHLMHGHPTTEFSGI
jgi:hypothetical protein